MTKKQVYITCAIILVLSVVAELMGVHMHHPDWWPLPFGYDIFFGFVGCWALIIVSKMIMAPILQRDENYYGGDDNE